MNKKKIIGFGVVVVAIVAYLLFQNGFFTNTERVLEDRLVENDEYSLSFNYYAGEDGYQLAELDAGGDVLRSYILVEGEGLAEYQETSGDIAPPTMSIFIFALPVTEASVRTRVVS